MLSVTRRIETVSQPHGGYVPKSLFKDEIYEDNCSLNAVITALYPIQGMAVDYLTRFIISGGRKDTFDVAVEGAKILDRSNDNSTEYINVMNLLDNIQGIDSKST